MAERIGQHGDAAVGRVPGGRYELPPGPHPAGDGGVDVVDRDVEMERRPVPLDIAG